MSIQQDIESKTKECNNTLAQGQELSLEQMTFLMLSNLIQEEGQNES